MVMRVEKTEKNKLTKPLYCLFNVRVDSKHNFPHPERKIMMHIALFSNKDCVCVCVRAHAWVC